MNTLYLQALLGLAVFIAIAWALSENRRAFDWRLVAGALGIQFAIAILLVRVPVVSDAMFAINSVVYAVQEATNAGTSFVFGYLGGGKAPFEITDPTAMTIFAVQALPLILVVSAISAVLWHWRVLPAVVRFFAKLLERALNIGGALGLAAAASLFFGMIEAPLLIRPHFKRFSRSELFTLMSCGLATVAGSVLVLYASVLANTIPGVLAHIITASIISVPAAIMFAKIMIPASAETAMAPPKSIPSETIDGSSYASTMDALAQGTQDGLAMLLNIIATLVVIIALVALLNLVLGLLPDVAGEPLSLQLMMGWAFAPVVWLIGIPWAEANTAGALMGTKTVLNEFIAYIDLAQTPEGALSPRSRVMLLYALCGFANFGSVGIMIGGLTLLDPDRRAEIASLSLRAMIPGTLATLTTGAVVGLIL